jgi:hypothetical protein
VEPLDRPRARHTRRRGGGPWCSGTSRRGRGVLSYLGPLILAFC